MIAAHPPDPNAPQPKRSNADLWAGLIILLAVLALAFIPYKFPGVFGLADRDFRNFLTMRLFTLGQVSISILFLLKAIVFFLLLSIVAARIRHTIYVRLRQTAMRDARAYLLARFTSISVYALGLIIGLEWTGLNLNTLAIVGGTLGIGIGFGLQQIVANWVAGLVLLIEQPVRIGDVVSVRGLNGTIIRIGGRSTWVRTYDDEVVIIPNSDFTNHQVLNWTANDLKVRLSIPVGVGYGSDPEQVRTLLLQIASDNPDVLKTPAPEVIFEALGDSSFNFRLRFWACVHPDHDNYAIKSNLYFAIVKTFREHGIEIPFPQRDVHFRNAIPPQS
jgi:small-conductance mechanosensitive channel